MANIYCHSGPNQFLSGPKGEKSVSPNLQVFRCFELAGVVLDTVANAIQGVVRMRSNQYVLGGTPGKYCRGRRCYPYSLGVVSYLVGTCFSIAKLLQLQMD